jgi:hypothetical protein
MKEHEYWLQTKAAVEAMVKKYGFSDEVEECKRKVERIVKAREMSAEKETEKPRPDFSERGSKASDDA